MINTAFSYIFAILRTCLTWINDIWEAIGDFKPVFVAIFTGIVVFNFIVVPMLVFKNR